MSITTVFSMLYMWWNKVEHFPFGAKEIQWILVARGVGGFFGVYGMYCESLLLKTDERLAVLVEVFFISQEIPACSCRPRVHLRKLEFTRYVVYDLGVHRHRAFKIG